ncbi:MAG: VWA domain-containing protein [Terracidiphilus sp.]|jgi:VWFA-related protein
MKTKCVAHSALFVVLLLSPAAALAQLTPRQSIEPSLAAAGIEDDPASSAPDSNLYADGTRAINEGRWKDAVAIFAKVAGQRHAHADGALYWKAYAENKQGLTKSALSTCVKLSDSYPKSRWIDECSALEIEIRAKSGRPVEPEAESNENLKLLALNSLMQKDEPRALREIQQTMQDDRSEELKEKVLFILAQSKSPQARQMLTEIAQGKVNSTPPSPSLRARAATLLDSDGLTSSSHPAAKGSLTLDVVVTDKSGNPVHGLESKDFTLLDNGQPSKILSFQAFGPGAQKPNPPVEVILLIDTVNEPFVRVSMSRQEIANFLLQNGGHLAAPVSLFVLTNQGVDVQRRPTYDGNGLAHNIRQLDNHLRTINRSAGFWGAEERFQLSLQAFENIAEAEAKKPGRKLLIWAGPGWPLFDNPRIEFTFKEQQQNFDALVQISTKLREARISVYSVSLGQNIFDSFLYQGFLKGVKTPSKLNLPNLGLKVFAVETGGRVLGPDNDMAAQISKCVQDASAYYTLSFDSPHANGVNEYHDLKVIVGDPALTARTRTGYYNQP